MINPVLLSKTFPFSSDHNKRLPHLHTYKYITQSLSRKHDKNKHSDFHGQLTDNNNNDITNIRLTYSGNRMEENQT